MRADFDWKELKPSQGNSVITVNYGMTAAARRFAPEQVVSRGVLVLGWSDKNGHH